MKRLSIATPCPAPAPGNNSHRWSISSAYSNAHDDTAQIEYTRAVEPTLKARKPRRSSLLHSRLTKNAAPVTVFEEVKEDEELVIDKPQGKPTLLSRPARKMAGGVAVGSGGEQQQVGGLKEIGQGRSRPSVGGAERSSVSIEQRPRQSMSMSTSVSNRRDSGAVIRGAAIGGAAGNAARVGNTLRSDDIFGPAIKKEPRRKTIYIPEDTTVLTIHPGANTTAGLDDTFNINVLAGQPAQQEEKMEEKESHISKPMRRSRMSLSAAPRRVPLITIRTPEGENVEGFDVPGDPTGKENLPPLGQKMFKEQMKRSPESMQRAEERVRARAVQQTSASQIRQVHAPRPAVPIPTTRIQELRAVAAQSTAASRQTSHVARPSIRSALDGSRPQPSRVQLQRKSPPPDQKTAPPATDKSSLRQHIDIKRLELQTSKLSLYPVLPENLAQPDLYEDSWLSQQEIALTEVVNEIFAGVERINTTLTGGSSLREDMISLYHQPEVSMLHRRLQASVMYGALSKPKEAPQSTDPERDIGLKRKFVGLFLDNYNEFALAAAAEVVVGRQIPKHENSGQTAISESMLDPHAGRRALAGFFQTFFVSPADVDPNDAQREDGIHDVDVARWKKSVLRCIMLIWLLDQAKSAGHIHGCLFKRTASKKSSSTMLLAFAGMMIPSVGDIARSLRQMDYAVTHVQDPLDEVVYRIDNLAVDLRSGIMLTHLVETLLYNRQTIAIRPDLNDPTVTIRLPDSTKLISDVYKPDMALNARLLSQHLKMPCISRVQKHFNVQIALSALEGYNIHGANIVGDITAEDVVNGHREKTLSLLWSLVSVLGLDHLIDFQYVQADTKRTDASRGGAALRDVPDNSSEEPAILLQNWATAHAIGSGIKVTNLTTSFADGRVYAAIVADFSCYLPDSQDDAPTKPTLESRLLALGCSAAFIKQLTSSVGNIPSRETTVSNLAFLASRLLPLARQHHAAITIQRCFRKHRAPVVASRRIALMRLAHHCAKVIQVQQETLNAAVTLQRAWRAVVDARIGKLSADVTDFQTLARGWAARRKGRAHCTSTARVMGEW